MPSDFRFDDVPLEQRLAKTIAWCVPRARALDVGIDVNPEECILWFDDAPISARDDLRHLLGR